VVELPSPYEGVVAALLVAEGVTADVGTPIISVEVGADAGSEPRPDSGGGEPAPASGGEPLVTVGVTAAFGGDLPLAPRGSTSADLVPPVPPPAEVAVEPAPQASPVPEEDDERHAVLVGYGVKPGSTSRRPRKAPAARPAAAAAPDGADGGSGLAVLAKPPVRKLAKDLGIDLSRLHGTGPGGSITRDDVQSAASGPVPAETGAVPAETGAAEGPGSPASFTAVTAVAREERIPIRGVRKHMAAAMVGSAFSAPHVTEFLQIDMTETMAATARLRTLPEFSEVRVSPLVLVARALMVAVARHPMINSFWDEEAQEIVVRHYVNLGIAAATERGLIVPNIRDAHALSLPGLARALAQLAETARAGKATPADLRSGTITITNVGVFGVDTGTPILTPGEAAILAFGRVKDAPWVHEGQLAVRKVTTLALSFDHRIVDGDLGSAVLRDIGAMLEDPLRMLAWS
jgi:pyruvate dehydrogenase E2 component (dihydrolipoamide acetyltransferase)